MSKKILELLVAKFGASIVETHSQFGDDTAVIAPAAWREVALFLRDDPRCAMNMFTDLCGVDYPDREPRFEVVCHLRSLQHAHRIRIKARVGEEDGSGAELDSLVPVWKGANWFERECFDMFGVKFTGHPDMRRILTEPEASLIKQYVALLKTEEVTLDFTDDAIDALADLATEINATVENIGARRLQTVLERLLEDVSFTATEMGGKTITIDGTYVRDRVAPLAKNADLSKFIL